MALQRHEQITTDPGIDSRRFRRQWAYESAYLGGVRWLLVHRLVQVVPGRGFGPVYLSILPAEVVESQSSRLQSDRSKSSIAQSIDAIHLNLSLFSNIFTFRCLLSIQISSVRYHNLEFGVLKCLHWDVCLFVSIASSNLGSRIEVMVAPHMRTYVIR